MGEKEFLLAYLFHIKKVGAKPDLFFLLGGISKTNEPACEDV